MSKSQEQTSGVIVTADDALAGRLAALWPDKLINWTVYNLASAAMEGILTNLPGIIVISMSLPDLSGIEILNIIKAENVYRQVPIMLCLTPDEFTELDVSATEADDFFILPGQDEELKARIQLAVQRAGRSLDANPLSRLPGNTSIIQYVQKRIDNKDDFAMCYCDLDYFKSFNDKYGFTRGDEVLLMTARIVLNTVRFVSPADYFVGHVGGDDFMFVVPTSLAEKTCQQLIAAFDSIVPQFYDPDDRAKQSIVSIDRQGVTRIFPLMAISIAVVTNTGGKLNHVGEASAIATNLKKKAKESISSIYVIDRRQN